MLDEFLFYFFALKIANGLSPIPLILLPVLYTVIEDSAVLSAMQSCTERGTK